MPNTSENVPIVRLLTITDTASFIVSPSDSESYIIATSGSAHLPSRDLELGIARPGEARFFALMLFGVNWMLSHSTTAYVALAWKTQGTESVLRYLALCIVTLLAIPGIRNAMPDAPGFDGQSTLPCASCTFCSCQAAGVLIDQIGFFAQMLLSGISTIVLLATLAKRELQHLEQTAPVEEFVKERPAPISKGLHKMRGSSTSVDLRHLRALSRPFTSNISPPTPIREEDEGPPYTGSDPFAASPSKGKGPMTRWGTLGQNGNAR